MKSKHVIWETVYFYFWRANKWNFYLGGGSGAGMISMIQLPHTHLPPQKAGGASLANIKNLLGQPQV